jgi:hypothetical protein
MEALPTASPETRMIVLKDGRIAFNGSVKEFNNSEFPAIQKLAAADYWRWHCRSGKVSVSLERNNGGGAVRETLK